jgi:protein-S-isoprenylcysteine O-methyltransferase Ste14
VSRTLLVRAAGLYLPLAATVALWLWRRPDRRRAAAALLAGAWNLPALLLLHAVALRLGWWRFDATGGLFLGIPVDLYLGWALLWGPAAALAFPALPLSAVLAIGAAFDLAIMPAARPVVVLGDSWLLGELAGLIVVLWPAQLLARWTSQSRRLAGRAALQVALFGGLALGVLPAVVLKQTGGSPSTLADRPRWLSGLLLQLALYAAIPGLSAVQEFCERGLGTPLPYDPPQRLVTSGVFAYVANPMQVSMGLVLFAVALALQSPWIAGAAVVALAYGAGFASWHEDAETASRFGWRWVAYRSNVSRWRPRFKPWIPSHARLFVAESCGPCSEVGDWLRARKPAGLDIVAAEEHSDRDLFRMTYEAADGASDEGVAAFARALEHIHLGWAFLGWTIRLPVLRSLIQVALDVSGAGPRAVGRRASLGASR